MYYHLKAYVVYWLFDIRPSELSLKGESLNSVEQKLYTFSALTVLGPIVEILCHQFRARPHSPVYSLALRDIGSCSA